ncbi:MAG TPA: carboxypeptidase regulatory-like domain-containing protein [Bryobacteraceae bacterium]|nr:carboxypeptidase regulatory-like domain-containing protein [Bryobacteraceae bacterium]
MTLRSFLIALSILLGAGLTTANAQVSTASVNGIVRDSSGGVIPGATLVLRNTDTGVGRNTVSNSAGVYVFLNVLPGTYTLTMSKPGFSTEQLSPFLLEVNQTATFDGVLKVGTVQSSLTVEAAGAAVEASTSELGAVVETKQVSDLPLNGRNFTQLLSLTPGVSPVSVAQNSGGGTQRPIGSFEFPSVNGQPNRSNFFLLDGIINEGSLRNTYAVPPIIDGIQEFKVQSHNDEAEFGGVLGGIVNVVSKSGTNQLHGSAWEFLRNSVFDARSFFLASVTPYKQNQFGVAAGGPVVLPKLYNGRNHTFFFLAYQGYRFRQTAGALYQVPTTANLTGDLSNQSLPIYNPYTTQANPSGTGFVRQPFPGNQIPTSLIAPVSLAYVKNTMPAPIATGVANRNAINNTPISNDENDYSARADQNIGEKDFIWFRFSGLEQTYSASAGRQELLDNEYHWAKNLGASWTHIFGPSSVMQVQYGWLSMEDDTRDRFVNLPANFGVQNGFSNQFAGNFRDVSTLTPAMNVPDYFSGGELDQLFHPSGIQETKAGYSLIHGNHTFKVGGNFETNGVNIQNRFPIVTFNTTQTNNPQSPGNTGSALASFLLDLPDTAERRDTVQSVRFGGTMGYYFQDQWKATGKLTVNLGIRYDRTFTPPFGTPGDNNEYVGDLNLNNGTYVLEAVPAACSATVPAPCIPTSDGSLPAHVVLDPRAKIYHDTTMNWQPRVGLAYRLRPNTAVRAGFGVFFDEWSAEAQYPQNQQGAWPSANLQSVANLNVPTTAQVPPNITGLNPFPSGSTFPTASPFLISATSSNAYVDPYIKNPYSMQWNFGIEHQLNQSTVLTVNYVGSGSRRLPIRAYYNTAVSPGPGNPQSRAPYPYMPASSYDWSWGTASYNALQVLLNKRYSNGLAAMISYTYSKSLDTGCSGFLGEDCDVQDPHNIISSRSVSGFDLTQILTVNWLYALPVGKGGKYQTGNRVADYIIGGWQLNGIATLRSGLPYTINVNGDITNLGYGGVYMRPNLVGDPTISNPTPSMWLNKAAFASPALYTFGDLARDSLRSEWVRNFDLSVFRQFPILEHKTLEFRAEAFNAFNTPTFSAPTANTSLATFGQVFSTSSSPRQLQLSLKILF